VSSSEKLAILGGTPVLTQEEHGTWPRVEAEERAAVSAVLDRGILSGGSAPAARAFERAFAERTGTRHGLLCHSGTSALQVAVAAVGVVLTHQAAMGFAHLLIAGVGLKLQNVQRLGNAHRAVWPLTGLTPPAWRCPVQIRFQQLCGLGIVGLAFPQQSQHLLNTQAFQAAALETALQNFARDLARAMIQAHPQPVSFHVGGGLTAAPCPSRVAADPAPGIARQGHNQSDRQHDEGGDRERGPPREQSEQGHSAGQDPQGDNNVAGHPLGAMARNEGRHQQGRDDQRDAKEQDRKHRRYRT